MRIILKLDPIMQYILGLVAYPTMDFGILNVGRSPKAGSFDVDVLRNPLSTLWIFSNIVQPSYIKDTTRPLLRCIALDRRSTQISHEATSNLQYKPLCKNNIQRIKIWLAEDYMGIPLFSNTKTYIRLEFIKMGVQ